MRRRGPLRWNAAGKNGGKGVGVSKEGLFVFPTDDPEIDPEDGEREVTTPWCVHSADLTDLETRWSLGWNRPESSLLCAKRRWF